MSSIPAAPRRSLPKFAFLSAITIALASSLFAAPASATWGVGANLGVSVLNPVDPGESTTLFGAPSSTISTLRPGFRLSYAVENTDGEAYFDLGYDARWQGSESARVLRLGGNFQYNFGRAGVRPFVTVGAGILNISGSDFRPGTSGVLGGGVGVGFPVASGAGRLRMDVRADKILESKYQDNVIIGEATLYQLGLGFDLWIR